MVHGMHFHDRFVKQRDVQLYCFLSTPQPNTGALESSLVRFLTNAERPDSDLAKHRVVLSAGI